MGLLDRPSGQLDDALVVPGPRALVVLGRRQAEQEDRGDPEIPRLACLLHGMGDRQVVDARHLPDRLAAVDAVGDEHRVDEIGDLQAGLAHEPAKGVVGPKTAHSGLRKGHNCVQRLPPGRTCSAIAPHFAAVAYAVDRLGWLQFQQLCTGLLELDGRLPSSAWAGTADACRFVLAQDPIGPPLAAQSLPAPVLVHCAWIRDGGTLGVEAAIAALAHRHPEDFELARSYLLVSNVEVPASEMQDTDPRWGLSAALAIGPEALGARIDALPELRLAMPSLLGLGALDGLISSKVGERSSLPRDDAQRLAEVFVPTRAYWRALEVLRRHRFAVLAGPPEMGKTAIARMIGLAQMTAGWEAHECTDPDGVWRVFDPGRRQVFIADDAFGSTEYRADAAERWATAMERLLHTLDDRHWLIWTSRPAPLHAALRRLHRERGAERFPAPGRVLVDAGDLSVGEKTLILFRHAKAAELPDPVRREVRHNGVDI